MAENHQTESLILRHHFGVPADACTRTEGLQTRDVGRVTCGACREYIDAVLDATRPSLEPHEQQLEAPMFTHEDYIFADASVKTRSMMWNWRGQ